MSTPVTYVNEWTIDSLARVAGLPGPFTSRLRRLSARGYGVHYVASPDKIHFVAGRSSVSRTVKICQVRPHPVAIIVGPVTRSNPEGIRFLGGEPKWVERDLAWFKSNDFWSNFPNFSFNTDWYQEGNKTPPGGQVDEDSEAGGSDL